jgi:hypothetical protein
LEAASRLDATELVFVSNDDVERWARVYCKEQGVNYDDFEWQEILDAYLLNHPIQEEGEIS